MARHARPVFLLLALLVPEGAWCAEPGDRFESFLKPLFARNCTKCHGGEKVKGKVNLEEITTSEQFLARPGLLKELIEVIEANDMPPEEEPELAEAERARLLEDLKASLRRAAAGSGEPPHTPVRRLNRFQYNNAVKDLFALNRDVFALPERLMTRHSNYLVQRPEKVPERVEVSCRSLAEGGGMDGVDPFPKDLRAAHGYDNQANQLTLSPLLLDTFLKLSVSIVESSDFNPDTVGIWSVFFAEPDGGTDPAAEVRRRLAPFLRQAFRSPVDEATLDRYTAYVLGKLEGGLSFAESMKKLASAVLSSPRFLFRYTVAEDGGDLFVVASNLSFFLWGSGPDEELLRLAANGELARSEVFERTVARMLSDPRIERFLDSFPAQWMQLENVLGATPDPGLARLFSLDRSHPASVQMVLEPLLLFDAVFLENRPITELILPSFAYRSEFLRDWYASDLVPPPVDVAAIKAANREKEAKRSTLRAALDRDRGELATLEEPVRERLLEKLRQGGRKVVDLRPVAAWDFDQDLRDSVGSLHLKAHGKVSHREGTVMLAKRAFLQSPPLPIDLRAKTLEVWCSLPRLNQRGGGVMGIQGPGDFFDTIVLGERKDRHWISGSNGFARTLDFPGSTPESQPGEELHLAMVYREDGTTALFRNGRPYGMPYRKGTATFPRGKSSVLFGLRHLPGGGNRHLAVNLDRARLYDRALSAEEVAASSGGLFVTTRELVEALDPAQRARRETLVQAISASETALAAVPPDQDPGRVRAEVQRRFDDQIRRKMRSSAFQRVPATDSRFGGVITNAAMLSMTSGPKRTHPIARGAWIIEVIFNDPPPPPPNDVPPLNEDASDERLTIREKFAKHRENPDCAGCHSRLDPLGFALENFDIVGRWRETYPNGRTVDASGTLMKKHDFDGIVRFKETLVQENRRFARAFTAHLLRFALARELSPQDSLVVEAIVDRTAGQNHRLQALMREVIRAGIARHD